MSPTIRGSRVRWAIPLAALALTASAPPLAGAAKAPHKGKGHHPARHGFALKGLSRTLVPQVGVGDIKLPSTLVPAQILKRFGRPGPTAAHLKTIVKVKGTIVSIAYYPRTTVRGITFNFHGPPVPDNQLNQISVTSPAYQTPQGLHVGSTPAQVQKALPQVRCDKFNCSLSSNTADGRVILTTFALFRGRVIQIIITG